VDVDGARATEEDLLQQLRTGEHLAGVLGEVLEQLELFVGQFEQAATQRRGVGSLVDHELAEHQCTTGARGRTGAASTEQPQAGVDRGLAVDLAQPDRAVW
jgi:hypothetical protein